MCCGAGLSNGSIESVLLRNRVHRPDFEDGFPRLGTAASLKEDARGGRSFSVVSSSTDHTASQYVELCMFSNFPSDVHCLCRGRGRLGSTMGSTASGSGGRRTVGRNSDAFTAQMAAHFARPTSEPFDCIFVSLTTLSTAKDVQATLGAHFIASVVQTVHVC
jgi:hypothetical protein